MIGSKPVKFHLLTLLVLTVSLGIVMGVNLIPHQVGPVPVPLRGWPYAVCNYEKAGYHFDTALPQEYEEKLKELQKLGLQGGSRVVTTGPKLLPTVKLTQSYPDNTTVYIIDGSTLRSEDSNLTWDILIGAVLVAALTAAAEVIGRRRSRVATVPHSSAAAMPTAQS